MPFVHHPGERVRLQSIEQFIAVADAGSLRGAARRLGMSQPALTRTVQQLEAELGIRLMHRSVHGASLTPAGTAFLARARVAEAELRKAAEEARRTGDDGAGLTSLGVSPVGASILLPELVTTLLRQQPATRLRLMEMTPSALLSLVRDDALDMAVTQRTQADLDAGLQFRALFEINMRVAVRPGHPLLRASSLRDVAAASWLYMTAPGIVDDIVTRSFLASGLPAPLPAVHCNSYFVALDLIAATDLLGVLPPGLLAHCIAAGQLVEISLAAPLVPLQVGLYTRSDTPLTRSAKAVYQIIVGIARRVAATGVLRSTRPL
jgi:LysR family transcriptional regulator, regulator of abg operon